jgi:cholest-4-en-3-one 26-monooxygenase
VTTQAEAQQPSAKDGGPYSIRLDLPEFYDNGSFDAAMAWLRRNDPVHWQETAGFWVVSTHADLREVAADGDLFTTAYGIDVGVHLSARLLAESPEPGPLDTSEGAMPPIAQLRRHLSLLRSSNQELELMQLMSTDYHPKVRAIFNRGFTPKTLASLETWVRELTVHALNGIEPGQVADFVESLAVPVPVYVIAELLGVSATDRADFKRWSDNIIKMVEPSDDPVILADQLDQLDQLYRYFRAQIEDRRVHPRDDLLTKMVEARVDGEALSDAMIETLAMVILAAGNETTRTAISGGALALAQFPDQRRRLIEAPELLGGVVDEILRWVSPVKAFCRTATRDTVLHGKEIKRGDFMVLSFPSANRDEEAWDHPERFDVTRTAKPMHTAFSHGAHVCLGQSLARMELRVVFEELLARYPDYEIAGDVRRLGSTLVTSIEEMPVRFV